MGTTRSTGQEDESRMTIDNRAARADDEAVRIGPRARLTTERSTNIGSAVESYNSRQPVRW
jgi:hypothetical protein